MQPASIYFFGAADDLSSLNDRVSESLWNVYALTHVVLSQTLGAVRGHIGPLFKVSYNSEDSYMRCS